VDKRVEWPWSLEEEAEWKAELEQKDSGLVEELIADAMESASESAREVVVPVEATSTEESLPEKYLVTA